MSSGDPFIDLGFSKKTQDFGLKYFCPLVPGFCPISTIFYIISGFDSKTWCLGVKSFKNMTLWIILKNRVGDRVGTDTWIFEYCNNSALDNTYLLLFHPTWTVGVGRALLWSADSFWRLQMGPNRDQSLYHFSDVSWSTQTHYTWWVNGRFQAGGGDISGRRYSSWVTENFRERNWSHALAVSSGVRRSEEISRSFGG